MNVSNLACLAMLAVTFGSCKQEQVEDAETGSLVTRIVFERTTPTRATSTAIPATTWTNIKQVQLFLYETTTGTIKFSDIFAPTASAPTITKTWSMVPEGEYHLVLVANTKSSTDAVETTITGTSAPLEWTGMNVRGFAATALSIRHKPIAAGFPSNISSALGAGHALKPFESPSEIFMAYSTNPVKIESGKKTDLSASPLSLKRDVALMRVRVRANDKSKGFDNTDVDFAHADASVLIYTLPDHIGIHKEDGGVSTTSDDQNVIVGGSGTSTFSTTDPTSGYNPTKIVDGDFTLWRDVVVFPNHGGRKLPSSTTAPVTQRYYVVITGHARENHLLNNQTKVGSGGALVSWAGLVEEVFEPNTIRELNLTLSSGGNIGVPSTPAKEGSLTIQVSAPAPWDSNIKSTDLEI